MKRALLLIALFLLSALPLAPAASVAPEGAWQFKEGSATISDLAAGEERALPIDVAGNTVFAWRATLSKGLTTRALLDGHEIATLPEGSSARQIALPANARTLTFVALAALPDTKGALSLIPNETILPPDVLYSPWSLTGCVLPDFWMLLTSIAPLSNVTGTLDGEPVDLTPTTYSSSSGVSTWLRASPPDGLEGSKMRRLTLSAEDLTGKAWTLIDRLLWTDVIHQASVTPLGWTYELRPAIVFSSDLCLPAMESFTFTLDGEDATSKVSHEGNALVYRFGHDLTYEETHEYAFRVTLTNGDIVEERGLFIEGLDVEEFELAPGAVVSERTDAGMVLDLPLSKGNVPVQIATGAIYAQAEATVPLPMGGHARAFFAPRAIHCLAAAVAVACDPFGGYAPGFAPWNVHRAVLEVTDAEGDVSRIPGAGQLAAAARRSSLPVLPEMPEVSGDI